ncbi:hypothetical protein ACFL4J_00525 [Candidatus Margulisiibacteriota bacterium]
MAVQNNNIQQQSVAASLASADQVSDNMRDTVMKEAQSSSKTKPTESMTKQLLEDGSTKANANILSGLLAKLGDNFTPKKVSNKLAKEYEFLFEGQEEQVEDKVDLKSFQRIRKSGGKKGSLSQGQQEEGDVTQKGHEVKEYLKAYSSFLLSGSNELKKKIDRMEQDLMKDGKLDLKSLKSHRTTVANSVRKEVIKQMKNAFHQELFAGDKFEAALARHDLNKIVNWGRFNDRIGGENFGGQFGSKTQVAKEAAALAREDAKDFLSDELSRSFTEKRLTEDGKRKPIEEELGKLLRVAEKAGFDMDGFVKRMPDMLDDQGLIPIINYEAAPGSEMGQGQEGERRQYRYSEEEEKDIMMEQLRTLYMQKAIFGDWKTSLDISVRMVKTKNGLIKLGLKLDNLSELAVEGKKLAKVKLIQMLKEAFEERATYAQARGPAWQMTEKKIKTILKNLVKLGVELDDKDIEIMRDSANEKMFAEAEHELSLIDTALQARDTMYLRQKRKTVVQIMERIAAESNIPFNIDGVRKFSIAT